MPVTSLPRPLASSSRAALPARRRPVPRPRPALAAPAGAVPPPARRPARAGTYEEQGEEPLGHAGAVPYRPHAAAARHPPTGSAPSLRDSPRPARRSSHVGKHGPARPAPGTARLGSARSGGWAGLAVGPGSPGAALRPRTVAPAAGRAADTGGTALGREGSELPLGCPGGVGTVGAWPGTPTRQLGSARHDPEVTEPTALVLGMTHWIPALQVLGGAIASLPGQKLLL